MCQTSEEWRNQHLEIRNRLAAGARFYGMSVQRSNEEKNRLLADNPLIHISLTPRTDQRQEIPCASMVNPKVQHMTKLGQENYDSHKISILAVAIIVVDIIIFEPLVASDFSLQDHRDRPIGCTVTLWAWKRQVLSRNWFCRHQEPVPRNDEWNCCWHHHDPSNRKS